MKLFISKSDYSSLRALIEGARQGNRVSKQELTTLDQEIRQAQVVDEVDPDIVRIGSQVRLKQDPGNREINIQIVMPHEADLKEHKLSIFSPLATALLGYRCGSSFTWGFPNGIKNLQILEVK